MQDNPNNYPLFHKEEKGLGKSVLVDINDPKNIEFVLGSLLNYLKEIILQKAENPKPYELYFNYGILSEGNFVKMKYTPTEEEAYEDEIEEAYDSEAAFFFEVANKYPDLRPKIKEWVDFANALEKAVYRSDEHIAFAFAALSLALTDKQYLNDYIKFLDTVDLDHSVYMYFHMKKVLDHWGGIEETYPLIVMATCGLADQHIGEMVYIPDLVNIENESELAAFFKSFLLTIHSDSRGNKRDEYQIKTIIKLFAERVFDHSNIAFNKDRLKKVLSHLDSNNLISLKQYLDNNFEIS